MTPRRSSDWTARTEAARALTEASGPLRLPIPAYGGRSLPNVARAVVQALGVRMEDAPPLAVPLAPELDPFQGRRAEGPIVILLVDGFGWFPFARWAQTAESPEARGWGHRAHPITTVFPTTTVAALTSLSSGTTPAQHGVVAPNLYLPEISNVIDVLRMTRIDRPEPEELVTASWTPDSISGAPSLFRRGVSGVALSRYQFQNTGFNRILYQGAEFVGYSTASDLAHLLEEILRRASPPPVTFAYWDELDTIQHLRGPDDPRFGFEADRIAHLVRHVARKLDPSVTRTTTLLVTADHGQVPVDPVRQLRVDLMPAIANEMAHPLAGDRRAGFFAAKPGRVEALRAALEAHLPPGHRILPMREVVAAGLFGPPPFHPELFDRLGDFLALVPVPTGLLSPRLRRESRSPEFRGSHSGVEPDELVVPLVAGPLREWAGTEDPPG